MKTWITLATLLATSSVYAAEVVKLADGREVKLNDDFTWEYVVNKTAPKAAETTLEKVEAAAVVASTTAVATVAAPDTTAEIATIPVVNKKVGTTVVVNAKKPTMQLSDSGVDVLIGSASYEDGELIFPTSITNQSSQSVIQVEVEVQVFDMAGKQLAKENITVWQSIKRMADTYLRPQQAEQGKTIKLAVPQSQQYQFSAEVLEVKTR
ncbi:ribonuclease [Vibrio harveyi]|nr:ribonuclease [Vibrio harveyi]